MPAIIGFVPTPGTVIEVAPSGTNFTSATVVPPASGFVPFANVVDIPKFPTVVYATVENTLLADGVEKFEPGRGKPSDFEIAANYDASAYAAAVALLKQKRRFRIKAIDGSGIGWDGFLTEASLKADAAKNWTMSLKGQASGDTTPIAAP